MKHNRREVRRERREVRREVKVRKRRDELAKQLSEAYGVERLPIGVFSQMKNRWRFATVAAAELAQQMKAVRSVGIALTGENDVLTIEGCQILNPTENVIELTDNQADDWLRGNPIDIGMRHPTRYVVAKHGVDWLGGGLAAGNRLLPGLPSWRRIKGGRESGQE